MRGKLSYETQLYVQGSTVQIVQADGERIVYNKDKATPSLCSSLDPLRGEVRIANLTGNPQYARYTWRWPDGRELLFGANGQLLQISAPTGEFVSLYYDTQGWLIRVRDPQGRELRLKYLGKSAIAVDREGIAIAKAKHVYQGRTPALDKAAIASLKQIAVEGLSKVDIAGTLGISRASVYVYLKKPALIAQ